MAFQIKNPNWKSAIQQKAEQHAPAIAADLTRPVVNHICTLLALEVTGADDQTA